MKNILIIGSTGMLGRTVKKYFSEKGYVIDTLNRDRIDLAKCSYEELMSTVYQTKPDIVINCAGLIIQRKDTSIEDFLHVNSIIPRWLANICEEQNIQLYHPTTDCIYNGMNGPYQEGEPFNETGVYGVSKAFGEPTNCCVIRSSIIGEEEHNKLSLLEWVRSNAGNTINGYNNHYWNGVTCLEMAKIIHEIIDSNTYYKGTKHYYSPSVTKYEIIEYINEVYDLGITVNSINTEHDVNKTLISKYTKMRPDLKQQIQEQKEFWND